MVGRPLTVFLIVIAAWVVQWVLRKLVRRSVYRMVMPPDMVLRPLDAIGLQLATTDTAERARREARAQSIGAAAAGAVSVIVWTVAIIAAAGAIDIQLGPIIAATGIVGVALGFGAQSLVKDCINGVFILIEDQYGIGDVVDVGEAAGTVERISLRATVLRGPDGTVWHVPNGEIVRVGNRSQLWSVALVDVLVAYSADLAMVQTVLDDTARAVCSDPQWADTVIDEPTVLGVELMGADAVTVRVRVKTQPGQQWAIERALRVAFADALSANNVPLPPRATGTQPGAPA
jgi:small conductance mechanosensitive channel